MGASLGTDRSGEQRGGLIGDQAPERQRRGRRGRGRVAYEQHPARARDEEVVDQRAVAAERLAADPGRAGDEVVDPQLRDQAPRRGDQGALRDQVGELGEPGAPVAAGSAARSRARRASRAGRRRRSASVDRRRGRRRAARWGRAAPRRRRRGSGGRRGTAAPGRAPGRCSPGPGRRARRTQPQVGAAEGDDPRLGRRPGRRPRAGPTRRRRRRSPPAPGSCPGRARRGVRRRATRTARRGARCRRPPRRRRRRRAATAAKSTTPVEGECSASSPAACGSNSRASVCVQAAQAGDPVGVPAALELGEPRQLLCPGGDDQLPGPRGRGSRARRSSRTAPAPRRRRGAPSASPARSRCRRGSTPLEWPVWCAAIRGSRSNTATRGSGSRGSSSRATERPTIPAPITATSHCSGGRGADTDARLAAWPFR